MIACRPDRAGSFFGCGRRGDEEGVGVATASGVDEGADVGTAVVVEDGANVRPAVGGGASVGDEVGELGSAVGLSVGWGGGAAVAWASAIGLATGVMDAAGPGEAHPASSRADTAMMAP